MTRHARMPRRAMLLGLSLLSLAAPVAAQSPSVAAQSPSVAPPTIEPVATMVGPTIDPGSPVGRLLALRGTLESDRLLLSELRKDVPTTRDEGEAFVTRVVDLALASDPAAMGVIASRVRASAAAWLDWREGQYASAQEAADAYARSGAGAFDVAWESLHDAALLTVINRLDTIIDLGDRIEDGQ